jgi:hypothetical protein
MDIYTDNVVARVILLSTKKSQKTQVQTFKKCTIANTSCYKYEGKKIKPWLSSDLVPPSTQPLVS